TEIKHKVIDITPMIDAYFSDFPEADRKRRGNKMARERMSILYDHSALEKALVVGSSNKSEMLLGYGTIYGDLACAINPLGNLYKTQVRQLALGVGVPERIVSKIPSAGLWPGQTDEGELGFTYEVADKILYLLVDKGIDKKEVMKEGFEESLVEAIIAKIKASAFKRRLPIIAELNDGEK
ncbi:MAG: NAD(+) synthase, partial [Candidatus Subteraquimicrobiales bacterium]|nr:NAD(+) synthase [Candidatus Subteraquimicrobiales bacterium]